jgi:hypothetical protein
MARKSSRLASIAFLVPALVLTMFAQRTPAASETVQMPMKTPQVLAYFIAGILFGALAVAAGLKLAG